MSSFITRKEIKNLLTRLFCSKIDTSGHETKYVYIKQFYFYLQNTVVLENEEVMWSAPMDGPAVVVEVADTVPVAYIDQNGQAVNGHHPGNHHMGTAHVVNNQYTTQLDNMEYDYLYTNNVVTTNAGAVNTVSMANVGVTVNDNLICPTTVRQRQLDFCML